MGAAKLLSCRSALVNHYPVAGGGHFGGAKVFDNIAGLRLQGRLPAVDRAKPIGSCGCSSIGLIRMKGSGQRQLLRNAFPYQRVTVTCEAAFMVRGARSRL